MVPGIPPSKLTLALEQDAPLRRARLGAGRTYMLIVVQRGVRQCDSNHNTYGPV